MALNQDFIKLRLELEQEWKNTKERTIAAEARINEEKAAEARIAKLEAEQERKNTKEHRA